MNNEHIHKEINKILENLVKEQGEYIQLLRGSHPVVKLDDRDILLDMYRKKLATISEDLKILFCQVNTICQDSKEMKQELYTVRDQIGKIIFKCKG